MNRLDEFKLKCRLTQQKIDSENKKFNAEHKKLRWNQSFLSEDYNPINKSGTSCENTKFICPVCKSNLKNPRKALGKDVSNSIKYNRIIDCSCGYKFAYYTDITRGC